MAVLTSRGALPKGKDVAEFRPAPLSCDMRLAAG